MITVERRKKYLGLWNTMEIKSNALESIKSIVTRINTHKNDYLVVEIKTGCPWFVVGILHSLEADCNFNCHLHNGDPLSARTINVPFSRPKEGNPPFTWLESAIDAIMLDGISNKNDYSIPNLLYMLEAYNGFAYDKYKQNSPYLWSKSNHYISGKIVKDHAPIDMTVVSKQVGCAVLLKYMVDNKIIELMPLIETSTVEFNNQKATDDAKKLQLRLGEIRGGKLVIDGIAGNNTDKMYFKVTGKHLIKKTTQDV